MTRSRWPSALAVCDRVSRDGVVVTVIAVLGPRVRLSGTDGQVSELAVAALLAGDGVEILGGPSRASVPSVSVLADLPQETVARALWWERHIVEVIRGVAPDAPPGTGPRPEYDPAVASLTRREQAKAAELTAEEVAVTASAISKRRRRYETGGVVAMVDHRVSRPATPFGSADPRVVAALRQAVAEAAEESTRTATYLFWRTEQILVAAHGPGVVDLPSRRSFYRLLKKVAAGRHTTGSARTRRSLDNRPEGPFSPLGAAAPGELMEIDSTPLDVLVRLDDGVFDRVELTGLVDVATRTVPAAVLRPTTKAVDASVLLARMLTPEPMRPGWADALRMSVSALPYERLLDIDARFEHAAARPVTVPDTIVIDHGKVFVSRNFQASCRFLGVSLQPCGEGTPTDKPHIERTLGSCASPLIHRGPAPAAVPVGVARGECPSVEGVSQMCCGDSRPAMLNQATLNQCVGQPVQEAGMRAQQMLDTYPKSINLDRALIAQCIEVLVDCSQACTACADACLSEDRVAELVKCVRTNLDCADICDITARILSRHTGYDANLTRAAVQACAQTCATCADECERHAQMHHHCRVCAEACRQCEEACRNLLAAMS